MATSGIKTAVPVAVAAPGGTVDRSFENAASGHAPVSPSTSGERHKVSRSSARQALQADIRSAGDGIPDGIAGRAESSFCGLGPVLRNIRRRFTRTEQAQAQAPAQVQAAPALVPVPAPGALAPAVEHQACFGAGRPKFVDPEQMRIAAPYRYHALVTDWAIKPPSSAAKNHAYGQFMSSHIEQASRDIASGKIGNLNQLWDQAREVHLRSIEHRYGAANEAEFRAAKPTDDDMALYEGSKQVWTTGMSKTPMGENYAYIHPRVLSKMTEVFAHPQKPDAWKEGNYMLNWVGRSDPGKDSRASFLLAIDGRYNAGVAAGKTEERVLWAVTVKNEGWSPGQALTPSDVVGMNLMIAGPDPVASDIKSLADKAIYQDAQSAFAQALDADSPDAALDHAFAGYWELVSAAPDHRGSAAKSHFILQSVLLSRGIDLPPAAGHMAPDLEAMSRSRDDWVAFARTTFGLAPLPGQAPNAG